MVVMLAGAVVALADTGRPAPTPVRPVPSSSITSDWNTSAVDLSAPSAELINADTGQILYAHDILARRYPASIVKLMTSLIALELVKRGQMSLNSIVPVSDAAFRVAQTPGLSVAYLDQNQRVTLKQMLEFMYVVSADDAAVAVADDIGGTEKAFARMMNKEAEQLGLTGTHYTNASGLQDPGEYTNARDIAVLSRYLIAHFPIVLKWASEPGMYIHPGQYGHNYDQLLGQYTGLDGLKTGSTDQAGYCFVGTAKRHGIRLISVVLKDPSFNDVFQNTVTLLDYGFHNFHYETFAKDGPLLQQTVNVSGGADATLTVAPSRDVSLALPVYGHTRLTASLSAYTLAAPVKAGTEVGMESIAENGHVVLRVPVYAARDDARAGLVTKLWRAFTGSLHRGARAVVHWFGHKASRIL